MSHIHNDELTPDAASQWLSSEIDRQIRLIRRSRQCVFCGGKKPVKRLVCRSCSVLINTRFPNPYN